MKGLVGNSKGFSITEIFLVLTLLAVVAGLVAAGFVASNSSAKTAALRSNLGSMRQAVHLYQIDHGFYPCTAQDFNSSGTSEIFVQQMTWFTDATGEPAQFKDEAHSFGPYLNGFPDEPISGVSRVVIDTKSETVLSVLGERIARGSGKGGWFYEARSGHVVANLGSDFSEDFARY